MYTVSPRLIDSLVGLNIMDSLHLSWTLVLRQIAAEEQVLDSVTKGSSLTGWKEI